MLWNMDLGLMTNRKGFKYIRSTINHFQRINHWLLLSNFLYISTDSRRAIMDESTTKWKAICIRSISKSTMLPKNRDSNCIIRNENVKQRVKERSNLLYGICSNFQLYFAYEPYYNPMFYVFYLSPLALNTPIPAKWNIYLDIDSTWWNICLHNSFRRGTAALIYYDFHPNTLSLFNFRHQNVYSNDYIEQTI